MSSSTLPLSSPPSRVSRARASRVPRPTPASAPAGPLAAFLLGAVLALVFAAATRGTPLPL